MLVNKDIEQTRILICCCQWCNMAQPFWKSLAISYKVKHTILFLGLYTPLIKTWMFIAALFTIVINWKQSKCPLRGKWINTLWLNEILLNNKNKWLILNYKMDESQKHYSESTKPDTESTHCMISFISSFRVDKTNLWWKKSQHWVSLVGNGERRDWLGRTQRNFGEVREMFCILMEELCIYQTHYNVFLVFVCTIYKPYLNKKIIRCALLPNTRLLKLYISWKFK